MPYAIELLNITKRFARTLANDDVTLRVASGSIHALVGENGAGKTTLMETLYGLYQPDAGRIRIHEKDVSIKSPHDSIKQGIGMVHQHFMLVPPLTVLENIVLGAETTRHSFLDLKKTTTEITELAARFSLSVPLNEKVENIGVGIQQRVEILKAIYRKADILVLDEPTAVLTPQETDQLFRILAELREEGRTIVLITHKLNEVMAISDQVSVMRKGKIVGEIPTKNTNPQELAQMMVGRPVLLRVEKAERKPGDPVLTVNSLSYVDRRGIALLKNLSLEVASGEILGIAGVEGNGQSQLVECITGLIKPASGSITVNHVQIAGLKPREIFARGLAHVPEDRIKRGLVIDLDVKENLILGMQTQREFGTPLSMDRKTITRNAQLLITKYDIRPTNPDATARGLSGGNQQKVIIARELSRNAQVIVASQPTRGVDIGGIEFIHRTLVEARDDGKAILLISADLNEILSLSDRIAVMYGGRIVKIFPDNRVEESELGLYMTGSKGNNEQMAAGN
ncbi:MAG: ABC transporter ATP-binding protein [Bacteroidetes bacterium]|nr:ABC transporter ATP-binding protein [Bacteroidota bacterium]